MREWIDFLNRRIIPMWLALIVFAGWVGWEAWRLYHSDEEDK